MVKGGVIFPMLSDPGGKIGSLYGIYDQGRGGDARGCFLIDPDGEVRSIEILSDPVGRNVNEILRKLRALRHHRSTGDVMPCGWQPGRPSLPPGSDGARDTCEIADGWKTRHAF